MGQYEIILYHHWPDYLTLEQLAAAAEVHPELVRWLVDYGTLEPVAECETQLLFDPDTVHQLRAIMRLRSEIGVGLTGAAVIWDLTEKVRSLEQELAWYRNQS